MSKSCCLFDEHDPTKYFSDFILSGGGIKSSNATGFDFIYKFNVNEVDNAIYFIDITRNSIFGVKKYYFLLDFSHKTLVNYTYNNCTPMFFAFNDIEDNDSIFWLSRFFKKIFNITIPRYSRAILSSSIFRLYETIFNEFLPN